MSLSSDVTNAPRSVLVVSSCSATKRLAPIIGASREALADSNRRAALLMENGSSLLAARDLYMGRHHRRVVGAVDAWRRDAPGLRIDLNIVSAGYGLLGEYDEIVSYDVSFASQNLVDAREHARKLGIATALQERLPSYDAAIFLLGEDYLSAIEAPFGVCAQELYFASPAFAPDAGIARVDCGRTVAASLSVMAADVRATLFERFVAAVGRLGWERATELAFAGALPAAPGKQPSLL